MKIKLIFISFLLFFISLYYSYYSFKSSEQPQIVAQQSLTIENDTFAASQKNNAWEIILKREHFPRQIKSVTITYNNTFYGVFLLTDKIYLPALISPIADLVITSLNEKGKPSIVETFKIETGDANGGLQIPEKSGY